jgi:hypothetical protein
VRELRDGHAQRFDFLRQLADLHVAVRQPLAHHPEIGAQLIDLEVRVGEYFSRRVVLLVEPGVEDLQRLRQAFVELRQRHLQLLTLLLQHPQVRHHLHLALALRLGGHCRGHRGSDDEAGSKCVRHTTIILLASVYRRPATWP